MTSDRRRCSQKEVKILRWRKYKNVEVPFHSAFHERGTIFRSTVVPSIRRATSILKSHNKLLLCTSRHRLRAQLRKQFRNYYSSDKYSLIWLNIGHTVKQCTLKPSEVQTVVQRKRRITYQNGRKDSLLKPTEWKSSHTISQCWPTTIKPKYTKVVVYWTMTYYHRP